MALPLEGIRVLDVSQVAAVPMAARILADFGADVVHVENPVTGDMFRHTLEGMKTGIQSDINYIWENYNRNKKSVTIDLSQGIGQEILHTLLRNSDVFLTNLRPFELERFNLTYPILRDLNPRLVFGFVNGYGKEGPEKDAPAYDHTGYWARSGIPHRIRSLTTKLQEPGTRLPAFLPSFGDHMAGMILFAGVMTALYNRERTGEGDLVSTSLFQAGVYQQAFDIAATLVSGEDCVTVKPEEVGTNPFSGQYLTKDDRWLIFTVLNPERYAGKYCKILDREELLDDPRFSTIESIAENHGELREIFAAAFREKTLAEWKPLLNEAGIPFAPIQTHIEVANDPQARANAFYVSYDHPDHGEIEGVANPISLGRSPDKVRMPAPEFSEHTDDVLLENGYSMEELLEFKAKGVVF